MKMVAAKLKRLKITQKKEDLIVINYKHNLNLTKSISDETNAPKLLAGNGKDNIYLCVVITADEFMWWFQF